MKMDEAVAILKTGGLVAFPTETVYGLGADANNPDALRKLFAAKGRPTNHPLIVHVSDMSQLALWAKEVSGQALRLAEAFWPGPLTLILQKHSRVLPLVTGDQETIGIRIPRHGVAQALLTAFGGGLAAPSANRFGRISPTTAEAVVEELGGSVDLVLDGGPCAVGLESTIVDVSGKNAVILRPGIIAPEQIEAVLGKNLAIRTAAAPRVSGSLEAHYAPETTLKLVKTEDMVRILREIHHQNNPVGLLSYTPTTFSKSVEQIVMPADAENYARKLYAALRALDKKNLQCIVVEDVPADRAWDAIRDRLSRASSK